MQRPQTIQIFLPDGSPRSIKIAEITNRVVKAILIPRNQLENAAKRQEVSNVGLYFLFGESDEAAKPLVYIGEAEDCLVRLEQHNREKEFWNHAVVIVSRIGTFTKAHVRYLEYLGVKTAKEVNRYNAENGTTHTTPFVTEHMEAGLLNSFQTIKILLSTLGYPLFDSVSKKEIAKKELFFIKVRGVVAERDLIDDGFVVFKKSEVAKKATPSCYESVLTNRNRLLKDSVLSDNGGDLKIPYHMKR
ncbi:MAG: GIY-YIG nuclease family protein [Saprospiraceae bacterium]|nr:GIY-YIG nuclease family protein [Saprospiraceae bacterium]